MQLADVIRDISTDLNDQVPGHEYLRWPALQLLSYVNEALTTAGSQFKNLFTDMLVVKVQPGSGWQKACDCDEIMRIAGESDEQGNVIWNLVRSADEEANNWPGAVDRCPANPKDYKMTGYQISSTQDGMFRILPPMPAGLTRYVLVECYKKPSKLSLFGSVPDEVIAIVKQWVLYRALAVDSENNPSIVQLAQLHHTAFKELLVLWINEREREKRNDDSSRTAQKPAAQ